MEYAGPVGSEGSTVAAAFDYICDQDCSEFQSLLFELIFFLDIPRHYPFFAFWCVLSLLGRGELFVESVG